MTYSVKILCDSIAHGVRLTTMQVTMPRFILAEFNTHRMLSRNSASSRAIPLARRIQEVVNNPFVPEAFAANQKGMQAGAELNENDQKAARETWLKASRTACEQALQLSEVGVHKQWAARILEPYLWQPVVVTATDWDNFFNLRIHKDAQPEIKKVAELMKKALFESTPNILDDGEWHTPYITEQDIDESCNNPTCTVDEKWLAKLSTARCARVSYNTHGANKRDIEADIALHDRLIESGHLSPTEHIAMVNESLMDGAPYTPAYCGNFRLPWQQYRKMIVNEKVFKESK